MPIMACTKDGKPGFKWGESGACMVHDGTARGMAMAKRKVMQQAMAIKASQSKAGKRAK